jgi:hypothetical protein
MKFVFRMFATWLVGVALVLLIIDGTRMLSANAFVYTPFAETWEALNAASLQGLRELVETRMHPAVWQSLLMPFLNLPGWVLFGVPGLMLAFAGGKRAPRRFRRFEQL